MQRLALAIDSSRAESAYKNHLIFAFFTRMVETNQQMAMRKLHSLVERRPLADGVFDNECRIHQRRWKMKLVDESSDGVSS